MTNDKHHSQAGAQRALILERYENLVELARTYMQMSRATKAKDVAAHLRRMAKEYQRSAAALDGGNVPDIGEDEA
jgi:hypothetical protein